MNGQTYTTSGAMSFVVVDGVTYVTALILAPVGDTDGPSS